MRWFALPTMSLTLWLVAVIGIASWPSTLAKARETPTSGPTAPHVVGYFAEWNDSYTADQIPGGLVTDVIYSFARVSDGGIALSKDDKRAAGSPHPSVKHFAALAELKRKFPTLRTLVSVGGWGAAKGFPAVAADDAARQRFAKSCVDFLVEHHLDGVDIDWEFPGDGGNADDPHRFTLLLAELRHQLDVRANADGHPYLLTIASPAGPDHYKVLELAEIANVIDWFNLMTYDLNGGWSAKTDFNAGLFEPKPVGDAKPNGPLSVDYAVSAYLAAGVPKEKIVVGVPFFGHAWSGVGPANDGLFQPHDKGTPKPPDGGEWTYRTIRALKLESDGGRHWNDAAKVPWLYDPKTRVMVSYDDPESLRAKGDYVRSKSLGGVMIWELSQDDEQSSLLNALVGGLRGTH